jgi:hypothetical protein
MIAALLRERDGYLTRHLDDRVRQVDEQLEHYGYVPDDEPQGRRQAPQQTADQGKTPSKRVAKKTAPAAPPAPPAE